jgi:hypothetical protein
MAGDTSGIRSNLDGPAACLPYSLFVGSLEPYGVYQMRWRRQQPFRSSRSGSATHQDTAWLRQEVRSVTAWSRIAPFHSISHVLSWISFSPFICLPPGMVTPASVLPLFVSSAQPDGLYRMRQRTWATIGDRSALRGLAVPAIRIRSG